MPRKKKSGSGGVIGAALIGAFALLAAIPKEVWIGAVVLTVIGGALYLYAKSNKKRVPEPVNLREEPPLHSSRTSVSRTASTLSPPFVEDGVGW